MARAPSPATDELAAGTPRLRALLLDGILPYWFPATVDPAGGFRLNHGPDGAWRGPAPKAIVTQARMTWCAARLARAGVTGRDFAGAAAHGFAFLRTRMWDHRHGGFFWTVDADRPAHTEKHVVGQAFALLALSELAAAGDAEAAQLAERTLDLLDRHARDGWYGGYRESFSADWTAPAPSHRTPIGVGPDVKLLSTHMHLMAALTAHLAATRSTRTRERVQELILACGGAAVRHGHGAASEPHGLDWQPLRGRRGLRIDYGHQFELARFLDDAVAAVGLSPALLAELVRTLADTAIRHGYDPAAGGFFHEGPVDGPADGLDKVWWTQIEALPTLARLHRRYGGGPYAACFLGTLGWIEDRQADPRGEWHAVIRPDGAAAGDKADPWRCAFHQVRGLVECLDLLEPDWGSRARVTAPI